MKGYSSVILRAAASVVILSVLIYFVSPRKTWSAFASCDWRWLLPAVSIVPIFLASRVAKWWLLVRQIYPDAKARDIVRGYFWGMALGLVTPGRTGELARVWGAGLPAKSGVELFLLEKAVELTSVALLCALSLATLGNSIWLAAILFVLICGGLFYWKRLAHAAIRIPNRAAGWPSEKSLKEFDRLVDRLSVRGCMALTLLCLLLFCLQSYLLLNAMGDRCGVEVLRFIPLVFLANLLPFTLGGVGLRETLAVVLLRSSSVEEAVVVASFFLVTVLNLFVPGFVGALHYAFYKPSD